MFAVEKARMRGLPRVVKEPLRVWAERVGVRPRRSFGLQQLDTKLLAYLNFRKGFFVEAGANDGVSQSNTLYFERYLGWRGVLVEPIPELARRCRANRPRAVVEQCALVSEGFAAPTVEMRYCNLMSSVRGARGNALNDEDHIAAGLRFLKAGEVPYTLHVPARTLTSILAQHGVQRVDLLSLDVEGYEGQALRGLNLDWCAPRFILIEANDLADVESVLVERYEFIAALSHHDRLYRLRGDTTQRRAAYGSRIRSRFKLTALM